MKEKSVTKEITELEAQIFSEIKDLQKTMDMRKGFMMAIISELEDSIDSIGKKVDASLEKMKRYVEEHKTDTNKESDDISK